MQQGESQKLRASTSGHYCRMSSFLFLAHFLPPHNAGAFQIWTLDVARDGRFLKVLLFHGMRQCGTNGLEFRVTLVTSGSTPVALQKHGMIAGGLSASAVLPLVSVVVRNTTPSVTCQPWHGLVPCAATLGRRCLSLVGT